MKKILLYNLLFFVAISMMIVACKEEIRLSDDPNRHFISIAELRNMYQGEAVTLTSGNSGGHLFVSGVVLSHPAGNNVPAGKVIIQDGTSGQLRGITLEVEDLYTRYLQGDSIIAKIEGARLERVDGTLQVSGLTTTEIGRVSAGNEQTLHLATDDLGLLVTGQNIYENTLVSLLDVDVPDVIRNQVFGDGEVTLSDGTHTVLIKTMENANVANEPVPVSGNFTGIVSYTAAGEPYLSLRRPADIEGTQYIGPEFYPNFPEGFETAVSRKTPSTATTSGEGVLSSGIWYYTNGTDNSTISWTNGTYGVMLHGGNAAGIEMRFDLEFGASEFSFGYATATTAAGDNPAITLFPEYSQDGGQNWLPVDPANPSITFAAQHTLLTYQKTNLGIEGAVRFRIRKNAGGGRSVIDDVYVKPHE